jgi:hypothetical protein
MLERCTDLYQCEREIDKARGAVTLLGQLPFTPADVDRCGIQLKTEPLVQAILSHRSPAEN